MLKPHPTCNVCKAIVDNSKLRDRIFASKAYLPHSDLSLQKVHEEFSDLFSYRALLTHTKKHQFMSQEDFNKRSLERIVKDTHNQIIKKRLESADVFDEVMNQGMEQLQDGSMKIKATDLISAARYKKEFQLKEKDQELQMAEMMWHFASGENKESRSYDRRIIEGQAVTDYDPTKVVTNDSGPGENESSDIYHSVTWDAITQGSSPVPNGDNQSSNED